MRCIRLAVACFSVLLAACAATGPRFTEVQANLPQLRGGEGRIFFFRDNSAVGAAVQPDIRLGGEDVGALQPGAFFFVDRPAGHYTASARTESESSVDFDLRGQDTVYVSLHITMGLLVGRPTLTLHPPDAGAAAVQSLAYTGSIPLAPNRSAPSAGRATATSPAPEPAPTPTPAPATAPSPGAVTLDDLRGLLPPAR
ncbi:DUF2846 domain-containing protein [Ramlibacter tataouinensis]|uniref:DUF2846 domain-containing protein n=1 Tax=Ramlibacter tataouinensis TaxID=94132 RepID=UPI0022F3B3EB|nr:DUF2846 domain-containing protein [Ramlibacter tataouinensis]WBY00165.1 DUF2846 domain-containing protein [Ramlibacter tataouinensis]